MFNYTVNFYTKGQLVLSIGCYDLIEAWQNYHSHQELFACGEIVDNARAEIFESHGFDS